MTVSHADWDTLQGKHIGARGYRHSGKLRHIRWPEPFAVKPVSFQGQEEPVHADFCYTTVNTLLTHRV